LEQLKRDLEHRPFQPQSPEFIKFLENNEKRKANILKEFPFLSNRIK